jgi:cytoskeletal protein CcmA (bactofilin family)
MQTARGSRIDFELILIEITRRIREYFVACMRPKSGVIAPRADRLMFGGNRSRRESKMADQADDLGIPTKHVRPMLRSAEPPGVFDPSRPSTTPAPASPPMSNLPRPGAQAAHAALSPRQRIDQPAARDNVVEPRKLIVGQGISLSGEINSCDRLVVEGNVQANLQNCQSMTISETGLFGGNAVIDDVDVHGRFEGDLVVRKRLMIRASGHVAGTISYGEIEIEAGGRISGSIQAPRT